LLQRELSASLTVDKNTFGEDFLARYTESVTGLEKDIVVHANHVVYGRRGSGKSSLLSYAVHYLKQLKLPAFWVAMQAYASRNDSQVIASVLAEIFQQGSSYLGSENELGPLSNDLLALGEADDESAVSKKLLRLVPRMRKLLAEVTAPDKPLTIFLDDFHVLGRDIQPELLGTLYSLARGNRIFIKLSGIDQLTNLWDGSTKRGLEAPHDVQTLLLDHNLTSPDQSKDHIKTILDRHAKYCGLPGIEYLAADSYLDRLVLAAAAVPRDALSLFSKSVARSILKKQKVVSITSLNAATSEAVEDKLKDIESDISTSQKAAVSACLERVKNFCLSKQKKNAFLVKIANSNPAYAEVQKLVALRLVHVLHEGITPHKAGERYVALMLDYGFYIGIRAAKSIDLFPDKPRQMAVRELRTLPIFDPG
jgi:Cdc6-like AAA superfamily ATPase